MKLRRRLEALETEWAGGGQGGLPRLRDRATWR